MLPEIINYDSTIEGVIESYVDTYPFDHKLYEQVMGEWNLHKDDLKVKRK